MIVPEIQALILKLVCDPECFTLAQMRDLECKLAVYHKAKAMGLDANLIDDQLMVEGEGIEVL